MNRDPISEAEKVFQVLTKGRIAEREAVQNRLTSNDPGIDRNHLRLRIMEALNGPFNVANASKDRRSPKAWVRCWLLSTLGRIADNDTAAANYVRSHMADPMEPNWWARYWATESLVVIKAPDLLKLAKDLEPNESEDLVKMLFTAIVASANDQNALDTIIDGIRREDWATLRALRVVPLEDAVDAICTIVSDPQFKDSTYDSIVALGSLPPDWTATETAVGALIQCVKQCRQHPWWDGMRRQAIIALNNLGSGDAVPLLIGELADSNPSIVYEAARALEKVVGVSKATSRVVEVASQTGEEAVQQYANALRWMNREKVAEELASMMLSGAQEQQDTARSLLSEIGGRAAFEKLAARADTMKQHLEALEKTEQGIRELFDSSLDEARSGYRLGTMMDVAVFVVGLGFLVLSAVLIAQGRETMAGLTGAGGALAVLYNLFVANPRKRVQEAVEHLMALKVIFLGYLRQLHQADKAYVRRFLDDSQLQPEEVRQYSAIVAETMKTAIGEIREYSSIQAKNGKVGNITMPLPQEALPRS